MEISKLFLVVFSMCILIPSIRSQYYMKGPYAILEEASVTRCRKFWPISEGERRDLKLFLEDVTRTTKCYANCLLQEMGVIVNGQYKVERAAAIQQEMFQNESYFLPRALIAVRNCATKVGLSGRPGDCEYGFRLNYCLNRGIRLIRTKNIVKKDKLGKGR